MHTPEDKLSSFNACMLCTIDTKVFGGPTEDRLNIVKMSVLEDLLSSGSM